MTATWQRYVAIGDSFTEGMSDPDPGRPDRFRGWADRLAERLAADLSEPADFRYANLAVRGRLIDDVVGPQLTAALALRPDLISMVGGGNDLLRPQVDVDALAARLEHAVVTARQSGADVLLATPTDPGGAPVIKLTRGRAAVYTAHIHTIARRHGARVIHQWGLTALQDWRMWAEDRIHMTPEGHHRVAEAAYSALQGLPDDGDWTHPLPPVPVSTGLVRLRENADWAKGYLAPWVQRRLQGRSSGDGRDPKRPTLERLPGQ